MAHVKTSIGFEMEFDTSVFNDMELFDAISEVEKGNMMLLPEVCKKILGDRKAELYGLLRDENGRVPVDKVQAQLIEIIEQANGKNS
ncbi:MAG: hypothetical protein IKD66_00580 [Solobacterium sp.]|nr:hypothetical protein [Solobacterium sp.]